MSKRQSMESMQLMVNMKTGRFISRSGLAKTITLCISKTENTSSAMNLDDQNFIMASKLKPMKNVPPGHIAGNRGQALLFGNKMITLGLTAKMVRFDKLGIGKLTDFSEDENCLLIKIFCQKFHEESTLCAQKVTKCHNIDIDMCDQKNRELQKSCFYGKCD